MMHQPLSHSGPFKQPLSCTPVSNSSKVIDSPSWTLVFTFICHSSLLCRNSVTLQTGADRTEDGEEYVHSHCNGCWDMNTRLNCVRDTCRGSPSMSTFPLRWRIICLTAGVVVACSLQEMIGQAIMSELPENELSVGGIPGWPYSFTWHECPVSLMNKIYFMSMGMPPKQCITTLKAEVVLWSPYTCGHMHLWTHVLNIHMNMHTHKHIYIEK